MWEAPVKITSWLSSSSSRWEPSPSSLWWWEPSCARGERHRTRKSKTLANREHSNVCFTDKAPFSYLSSHLLWLFWLVFLIYMGPHSHSHFFFFYSAENERPQSPQTAPTNTREIPKTWNPLISGFTMRGWSSNPSTNLQSPTRSWQKLPYHVALRTSRQLTAA